MRTVTDTGSYTRKATGQDVGYEYTYKVLESIDDMPEADMIALANRMLKVDSNNTAREKAKSVNGDSTVRLMTAEEKAEAKQIRKDKASHANAIEAIAKARGMTVDEVLASLE